MSDRSGFSLLSTDNTGKVCLKWVLKTSGGTLDSLPWFFFPKSQAMGTTFLSVCVMLTITRTHAHLPEVRLEKGPR